MPGRPLSAALRASQSLFVALLGEFIREVYRLSGYELTCGDAARMDGQGHVKGSFHYRRLAIDLNLFVNGVYKDRACKEWRVVGAAWKDLNPRCTWGGDFQSVDLNHFSLDEGRRLKLLPKRKRKKR